ncbi:MAG: bifunctional DNA-formamidopyrimidine glycosylase/DNA-(apurinic or apyrimidinic site) lyase [Bacilli bacterium]
MEKIGIALNNMPELPEVETIKNLLKNNLIGKTIDNIEVIREKTILSNVFEFKNLLKNQTILDVGRKGKFLLFFFTNDLVLISHLRMEGKYYLLKENEPSSNYPKIIFHLKNEEKLIFDDSRCFGIMKLSTKDKYLNEKELIDLGNDANKEIQTDYFLSQIKNKNENIKSILLDQTVIAGIGNIYADESLYMSKINPSTPLTHIKEDEITNLLKNVKNVLNEAIKSGGSTIKSYHPGKGMDGNFQVNLKAYGKKDELCQICHHHFRFKKIGGRGTTYCPCCQKKKGKPLIIGIYGKIASGKSTVLNIFKNKKYQTHSADEIVLSLYQKDEVIKQINNLTKLNFTDNIDKNLLRIYLNDNPSFIKKLNNIIHPLVRKECENIIKNNKNEEMIIFEIPLLFEAHMEDLFDYIIGLDINKEKQIERIKERNKNSYNSLLKINDTSNFDKNKNRLDFIIANNLTINDLNKEVETIINKLNSLLN